MEIGKERIQMLDVMLRPAFVVKDGTICHINPAAGYLLLTKGMPIAPLLASGSEEYGDLTDCLQLKLQFGPHILDATVLRKDDVDIFLPDPVPAEERFRMLSLVSMQLREPMTGLAAAAERMAEHANSDCAEQGNRHMHRVMRILSNMSDISRFALRESCRMEYTEVCSFVEEILDKAATLLEQAHIQVESRLPWTEIYTLLDREQTERAIYNLLSNAAKFGLENGSIRVELSQKAQRLQLSVTNSSRTTVRPGNFYDRFLREPGLEDPAQGLGIGMVLVSSAAANHGGAVLIDQPEGCLRVTMTMKIQHRQDGWVRSPILGMDYAGERDHGLLELSDVLPAKLYRMEKN